MNLRKSSSNVGKGSYISPAAVVLGNVRLGRDVFVAPNATIRCDEPGSEMVIHDDCNVQDFDGCETATDSDVNNCGGCNLVCDPGDSCVAGACVPLP